MPGSLLAPLLNLLRLDPLAVRSFDEENFDVHLAAQYVTRPFQSRLFRVVIRPCHEMRTVAFVPGVQFPFHGHPPCTVSSCQHYHGRAEKPRGDRRRRMKDGFCPDNCPGVPKKGLK